MKFNVVLLTRDEHASGRWLLDLKCALEAADAQVRILRLSEYHSSLASTSDISSSTIVVNRVSDAAPPGDVKMCLSALRFYMLAGCRIINGIDSYTIGMAKVLHYSLFAKAGLSTPKYVVLRSQDIENIASIKRAIDKRGIQFPVLIKPNSGGFGKGIVRFNDLPALVSACEDAQVNLDCTLGEKLLDAFGSDDVAVLQEFVPPKDDFIYRAWFVGKAVHRAVRVRVDRDITSAQAETSDVAADRNETKVPDFNACVCSVPFEDYQCPSDIQRDIESLIDISKADCGSVEYLYDSAGQVQFFDFNLLSTLPDDKSYRELADYILTDPGRTGYLSAPIR